MLYQFLSVIGALLYHSVDIYFNSNKYTMKVTECRYFVEFSLFS